jgi:hypothetical protein
LRREPHGRSRLSSPRATLGVGPAGALGRVFVGYEKQIPTRMNADFQDSHGLSFRDGMSLTCIFKFLPRIFLFVSNDAAQIIS